MREGPTSQRHPDESNDSTADDPRVVVAVREYMAALESGVAPSREQFIKRHTAIAGPLADCLDGLEMVHQAAVTLRPGRNVRPPELTDHSQIPLGDFRLIREIGRGGMGVVYEAQQLSLGRRVAVKVLPFAAALDSSRLERFKNEAQAAARLHHTNIVPIYAVGMERGVHFYAMQLIEGHSLAASIKLLRQATGRGDADLSSSGTSPAGQRPSVHSLVGRFLRPADPTDSTDPARQPLPAAARQAETDAAGSTVLTSDHASPATYFRTVARLMQQAATALEHAHGQGVVHRDIKPGNLLLDPRGNLWVTDFGLAQFQADVQLTRTGDMLGTLRYMSPEQAAGGRVLLDQRTDIYSLGVTMYELLTLEPAFDGSDRQVLLGRILHDEPRPPRALRADIPVELETIVLKATAKAPAERYATAQQLADDLGRWLDDRPILARRPTLRERAARWRRRHQALVRSAIVVLCLASLGLVAGVVAVAHEESNTEAAYQRELQQRQVAEANFRQAREAVDTFTQLVEEELANKPSMHQLRRKFLATSLEYYREFLEQRADDPLVSKELEITSQRVARIVDELAALEALAPLMLLAEPAVRQELAIPAAQLEPVAQLVTQLAADRDEVQTVFESPSSTGQPLSDVLRADEQKLTALLTPPQLRRLKQISWQEQGPFAFKSPEIVAALKLTHDQRLAISQIIEEERAPGSPPDPPDDFGPPNQQGPPVGPDDGSPKRHGPPGRDHDFSGSDSAADHRPPHKGEGKPRGDKPPPPPPRDHHNGRPLGSDPHMQERMDRTVNRILAVLAAEQVATWKELIGETFH